MTHGDSLAMTIAATQRSLEDRLAETLGWQRDQHKPRDFRAATDTFLAATSRHVAAVEEVVVGEVQRCVPDDDDPLVADYVEAARDLEQVLSLVKARLYGEVHAVHLAWPELWHRVRTRLDHHNRLENELLERLVRRGDPLLLDGLAQALFEAEVRGPTRPHPLLPHTGWKGHVARRIWAVADRFWDAAEGRVIPDPVKPPQRRHDSLLAQYLVGDPRFDDHASMLEHHHTRRSRQRRQSPRTVTPQVQPHDPEPK